MAVLEDQKIIKGGEFLVTESSTSDVFIPEQLNEEQRMMGQMARDFVDHEILPIADKVEKMEEGLSEMLLEKAGELGLLGAGLPEEFGGMGVDLNSETVLTEELGRSQSFSVSISAHTGIGTLPILYYGTDEHRKNLLPQIASGQMKAAYCLTEPGSGSDSLAAKTKAILSDDGKYYTLTGQKMWITNAGFADIFTVFAKVDGKQFTGFLVPADSENLTLGAEEQKLGIKGSSTRQVFLEGVKVPVENVLGEVGKGHKIAFNVLNMGRYKLGAMVVGGCKGLVSISVQYANERKQFGQSISNFGAIKYKLAEQAILTFAAESSSYRISNLIQKKVDELVEGGMDKVQAKMKSAEEYSIECAILKVLGSEVLDYVVDESVQIHGGMGFSEESLVCRAYRDARINRIFEGTNEINRLLSVGMLLKKAMKGKIDLMTPIQQIQKELTALPSFGSDEDTHPLAAEKKAIANAKKLLLLVAGAATQKYGAKMDQQQQLMMYAADMLMAIFAAESSVLRVEKLIEMRGEAETALYLDMVKTYMTDVMDNMHVWAKRAIVSFAEGDEQRMMLLAAKRFSKFATYNTVDARVRIADKLIEANEYCF